MDVTFEHFHMVTGNTLVYSHNHWTPAYQSFLWTNTLKQVSVSDATCMVQVWLDHWRILMDLYISYTKFLIGAN